MYSDGGIYHNNPIHIADRERKLVWPNHQGEEPDMVLSIGSTHGPKHGKKRADKYVSRGIVAHGQFLKKMARDHLHKALDSEETWNDYISVKNPSRENRGRSCRINPQVATAPPKLDEVDRLDSLQDTARRLMQGDPMVASLARRLVATCFYFEPTSEITENEVNDTVEMSGE